MIFPCRIKLCNTLSEICLLRNILFICEKYVHPDSYKPVENPFVIIAVSIMKNANIAKLLPKCDIVHSYYYYTDCFTYFQKLFTLSVLMVKKHHVLVMKEDKHKPLLVTFADCSLHIPLQIHWQLVLKQPSPHLRYLYIFNSGDPGVEPLIRNEFDDDPFPSIILKSLSCHCISSIYEGKTQKTALEHILKHLKSAANSKNRGRELLECKIESSNSHIKLTVLKTIAETINSISNFTFNMLITNIE
ncbi:hypothetical protein T06_7357 [Trichinella sp. T6]|nr:hypothetical protein T06_7357 [Trichinella sp. T6]